MGNLSRRGFMRLLGGGAVAAALAPLVPAAPASITSTIELVELSPSLAGFQIGTDVAAGIVEGLAQNGLYAMPGLDQAITTGHRLAGGLGEIIQLPPPTPQQIHERLTVVEGEVSILDTRLDAVEGEQPDLYPGASGAA